MSYICTYYEELYNYHDNNLIRAIGSKIPMGFIKFSRPLKCKNLDKEELRLVWKERHPETEQEG